MTPPTVNAYYNPQMNEIVFPAGILQPPFFDPKADDAVNYGAIGVGDRPRDDARLRRPGPQVRRAGQPAATGGRRRTRKNFEERADVRREAVRLRTSSSPTCTINGKLVLGESIADLGGLDDRVPGVPESLRQGKPPAAPIDGFTADQRFFLAWARVWAANVRPRVRAKLLLNTNPHPLAQFRAIGAAVEHAGVREGVRLQAGRPDGPHGAVPDLVSV